MNAVKVAGRRVGTQGLAQVVLALWAIVLLVVLMEGWTAYQQIATAKTQIAHVVAQSLATGVVTGVPENGGYETEPWQAAGPPQVSLAGVVSRAATFTQNAVSGSTVAVTGDGWQWTLPTATARSWAVAGPITVSDVTLAETPYRITATVSAPVAVPLWGFTTVSATMTEQVTFPIAGQTGPAKFVSY